jgi:hypothetical protein
MLLGLLNGDDSNGELQNLKCQLSQRDSGVHHDGRSKGLSSELTVDQLPAGKWNFTWFNQSNL